jgi:uncharacterized protein (DUF885 family)
MTEHATGQVRSAGAAGAGIDQLAEEMLRFELASSPTWASQAGYREYIGELPPLSAGQDDRRLATLAGLRQRAEAIDPAQLGPEQAITRQILLRKISDTRLTIEARTQDYTVTPITQTGLAAAVLIGFPKTPLSSAEDAERYLERCRKLPAWLADAGACLDAGAAAGRTPVHRLVQRTIDLLTEYLAAPLDTDPLLAVSAPADAAPDWRDRLGAALRDDVRPAFAAYRGQLAAQVLGTARPDDRPGLVHLPGGAELYQRLVAVHTTTDLDMNEIHQTGRDLVAALTEEMRELGAKALQLGQFGDIVHRLRTDRELFFRTPDEVADAASRALSRAQQALPSLLSRRPATPCVVRPMRSNEVENGTLGYYQRPTRDGSRPGTYWINTYQPETRPRFEAEVLAHHESVPGHHTQLALAQELTDQSEFRQHAHVTAFSEGWALYMERVTDEIGLYTDDICRLGMISFDFWRACRLVVDTGMHGLGWTRDQAVQYMTEHSALTARNIDNEVDRYIGWPGQALGYMLGRMQLRRLRADAEQRLGSRFSLPDFHSEVLSHGSLPLSVLADVISGWAAER